MFRTHASYSVKDSEYAGLGFVQYFRKKMANSKVEMERMKPKEQSLA